MQCIVTDVPTCGAVSYAKTHGIPAHIFPSGKEQDTQNQPGFAFQCISSPSHLISLLQEADVDFVLLAGYLKLVPAEVVAAFHRRMLNIHPGLLPAFGGKGMYGKRVHQSVISSGSRSATAARCILFQIWRHVDAQCSVCKASWDYVAAHLVCSFSVIIV
jgi:phosphoribosylglycinamide formyltransferase